MGHVGIVGLGVRPLPDPIGEEPPEDDNSATWVWETDGNNPIKYADWDVVCAGNTTTAGDSDPTSNDYHEAQGNLLRNMTKLPLLIPQGNTTIVAELWGAQGGGPQGGLGGYLKVQIDLGSDWEGYHLMVEVGQQPMAADANNIFPRYGWGCGLGGNGGANGGGTAGPGNGGGGGTGIYIGRRPYGPFSAPGGVYSMGSQIAVNRFFTFGGSFGANSLGSVPHANQDDLIAAAGGGGGGSNPDAVITYGGVFGFTTETGGYGGYPNGGTTVSGDGPGGTQTLNAGDGSTDCGGKNPTTTAIVGPSAGAYWAGGGGGGWRGGGGGSGPFASNQRGRAGGGASSGVSSDPDLPTVTILDSDNGVRAGHGKARIEMTTSTSRFRLRTAQQTDNNTLLGTFAHGRFIGVMAGRNLFFFPPDNYSGMMRSRLASRRGGYGFPNISFDGCGRGGHLVFQFPSSLGPICYHHGNNDYSSAGGTPGSGQNGSIGRPDGGNGSFVQAYPWGPTGTNTTTYNPSNRIASSGGGGGPGVPSNSASITIGGRIFSTNAAHLKNPAFGGHSLYGAAEDGTGITAGTAGTLAGPGSGGTSPAPAGMRAGGNPNGGLSVTTPASGGGGGGWFGGGAGLAGTFSGGAGGVSYVDESTGAVLESFRANDFEGNWLVQFDLL